MGIFAIPNDGYDDDEQYPVFKITFLNTILAAFSLLIFLLTSIRLPRTVHPKLTLTAGCFSGPLTCSLLASIIFSPITFPWHGMLWNLEKCIFNLFYRSLQCIPAFFIPCIVRQKENNNNNNPDDEAAVAPRVEEVDEFTRDVEGNSMQNGTRH